LIRRTIDRANRTDFIFVLPANRADFGVYIFQVWNGLCFVFNTKTTSKLPDRKQGVAMNGTRIRGFTLIELMIVIVIIGLLAAVAYPTYTNQMMKGRRGAAQSFVLQASSAENQMLLDKRAYQAVANNTAFAGTLNLPVPQEVAPYYDLVVVVPSPATAAPSFRISAVPKGVQAGDSEGTLWLDSSGAKSWK